MTLLNKISHAIVGQTTSNILSSIIIPDVSFWEDNNDTARKVDFVMMKSVPGTKGVILRAGQNTWTDEDFVDYDKASKGVLPRGIYWFWDSRSSPKDQAKRIFDLVTTCGMPEMEIWCDYEETYNGPYSGWKNFSAFIMEIERLLPKAMIGIYTGYYYWLDHSPNPITQKANLDWFGKYPLWLAWYNQDLTTVKIPKPWSNLRYWQFTEKGDGKKYGCESLNVDLSYFNGTQD